MNIAFLVFKKYYCDSNRKNKSFDGQGNIGAYVIKDVLERAGYSIKFCSPETAHNFDVVLISLTSSYDVLNLLKSIIPLKKWENKSFKVIVGGPGVQNITSLRKYIDFAVFGRGENIILPIIKSIENKKDFVHESVMNFEAGITHVRFAQVEKLYPHELDVYPTKYKERVLGCNKKCLFCHYSFARKPLYLDKELYISAFSKKYGNKEVLFKDLLKNKEDTRIRTAIDGISQRLRFSFNKRISDQLIKEILYEITKEKSKWLFIYLIGNYPTETEKERDLFFEFFKTLVLKNKLIIHFTVTQFRPSCITPSSFLPVNLNFDWRKLPFKPINTKSIEGNLVWGIHSNFKFLSQLIIDRATENSDDIIKTVLFSKKLNKLKSGEKYICLKNSFDLSQYTREYSTEERLPTWYLESYIPNEKIKKMANILKRKLGLIRT